MKNSEEAIARVLAGLGSSETPQGMERRIRTAVQEYASSPSRSAWGWLRSFWIVRPNQSGRGLLVMALTGLFVVALSFPMLYQARRAPGARVRWTTPAASNGKPQFQRPTATAGRSPVPAVALSRAPLIMGRSRVVRFVRGNDSKVWTTISAASQPAPPLPLTNEEKLLLRLARNINMKQLETLNAEARARQEAESNAKFVEFFGR